jgi:hypothetical protein
MYILPENVKATTLRVRDIMRQLVRFVEPEHSYLHQIPNQ